VLYDEDPRDPPVAPRLIQHHPGQPPRFYARMALDLKIAGSAALEPEHSLVPAMPEDRLALGHEIDDQIRVLLKDRSLPWEPVFRKGYLAFQRKGGYNVLIVNVLWNRPVRLAVKLPDSLDNLEDSNPYPNLDGFWSPGEREWGWHVPSMDLVPDIGKLIELTSIHTPESGPLGPPAAD